MLPQKNTAELTTVEKTAIIINRTQTIITIVAATSVFGIATYFISKKSIPISIALAVVGGISGFFIDAKIQSIKG